MSEEELNLFLDAYYSIEEIEDEAAVLFSEAFYELLFKEKLTSC